MVRSFTWCGPLRGAVLPGRKHERSEASPARGMRGQLRGLRPRRTAPRLRGLRPGRTAPRLRGLRPRRTAPPLRGLRPRRTAPRLRGLRPGRTAPRLRGLRPRRTAPRLEPHYVGSAAGLREVQKKYCHAGGPTRQYFEDRNAVGQTKTL